MLSDRGLEKWFQVMLLLTLVALSAQGADAPSPKKPNPPTGRSKSLSFDDSVVEGMNQNPLDSLETVGKQDRGRTPHLYKRRLNYRKELQDSVREVGNAP